MDFKQFLAVKQALALVEHMETLSEQDAQQLFDTLDEETIEFIEAVLSENLQKNPIDNKPLYAGLPSTVGGTKISKSKRMYGNAFQRAMDGAKRSRELDPPSGAENQPTQSPKDTKNQMRADRKFDKGRTGMKLHSRQNKHRQ